MTERLWFKIGETASLVGATPKELRYWERVIPELKPRRSRGNLRYYHQEELAKLQRIRQWLTEGFTVADCRELLRGGTPRLAPPVPLQAPDLSAILTLLRDLHRRLSAPPGESQAEPAPKAKKPRAAKPKPEAPEKKPKPKAVLKSKPERPTAPPPPRLFQPEPVPDEATLPPTKSARRPKPEPKPEPLGRMWSLIKLPLDWDE